MLYSPAWGRELPADYAHKELLQEGIQLDPAAV